MVKVIIGSGYGDEGKGRLTDYLSNKDTVVIRFNGGPQSGHTAVAHVFNVDRHRTDRAPFYLNRHVFHHFGAGTLQGASTYLSRFFIVNPILYQKELKELKDLGVEPEIFIDENCLVTTPYDMMLNEIMEKSRGKERHGSCGCGINETIVRDEVIPIRFSEQNIEDKLKQIKEGYFESRVKCASLLGIPADYEKLLNNDKILKRYIKEFKSMQDKIISTVDMKKRLKGRDIIFEGAQGLMLDQNHKFFPHVTRSNTGIKNITELLCDLKIKEEPEIIYVTRCYSTRHGEGPFPGEVSKCPVGEVDETNKHNEFQGSLRYGNIDLDILKEAITKDLIDAPLRYTKSIAVTCLDQLNDVKFTVSNHTRTVPKEAFVNLLATHLGIPSVYKAFGKTKNHTTSVTVDVKVKPWFVTESLCELCGRRQIGCPYQYDGEECQEKRYHFLKNSL